MSTLAVTDDIFFNRAGLDRTRTESIVSDALSGADDGELYLEYSQSESLAWDDGKLKSASFDTSQGFGLRAVQVKMLPFDNKNEFQVVVDLPEGSTVERTDAVLLLLRFLIALPIGAVIGELHNPFLVL